MEKYEEIIVAAIKKLFNIDAEVKLTRPEARFGDYATNAALTIAKEVGENPREIAEALAAELQGNDAFSEVAIAGPGFINLKISARHLAAQLESLNQEIDPANGEYAGKVVVTEFSDPNPFKVLHAGHLYTSVVGDAVSNLIEATGGRVHRVNYGGDVGLHAAKTMWSIVQFLGGEFPEKLNEVETARAEWLAARYVEGNTAYETDPAVAAEIKSFNKRIYDLHATDDHDSDFAKIYWECRQWSYDSFEEFYARIGVKFEKYYPESSVTDLGLKTVREQLAKGVYKESDGAVIFDGEKFGLHTRVFINREGLPTYEAKEVGLSLTKWQDYHFDESIIITGSEQQEYMQVVQKSIEQFRPDLTSKTRHFTNGLVKMAGGVKISSRTGQGIRAGEALDMTADAQEAAQGNREMKTILGAIKYAFLKNNIGPDLIFDPAISVSLTGNSGPYVQYAAVRVNKILRDNDMAINPENLPVVKREIVGGFIVSNDKKILLGGNRAGGVYEGQLIVPGGGIDGDETKMEALAREMREEVGIDIAKAKVSKIRVSSGGASKTLRQDEHGFKAGDRVWVDMAFHNYLIEFDQLADEIPVKVEDDFDYAEWFSRAELAQKNMSQPTVETLGYMGWLDDEKYDHAAEKTLILKLLGYPEILRIAAHEYEPHRIATYVYELARELNRYYETTPVATKDVPADIKAARLDLLSRISDIFNRSLGILGIDVPEKM
ncbi:arginine--tRNA ligase [Candidatus Saccharibacteria bacterium]|nr:arginine--tRNA ligase [Candidatus Saccharibacteria bacterium]